MHWNQSQATALGVSVRGGTAGHRLIQRCTRTNLKQKRDKRVIEIGRTACRKPMITATHQRPVMRRESCTTTPSRSSGTNLMRRRGMTGNRTAKYKKPRNHEVTAKTGATTFCNHAHKKGELTIRLMSDATEPILTGMGRTHTRWRPWTRPNLMALAEVLRQGGKAVRLRKKKYRHQP